MKNSPIVGLLPAGGEVTRAIVPPIDPTRFVPLVLTTSVPDVAIVSYDARTVTLRNQRQTSVPYLVLIAPTRMAKMVKAAASTHWPTVIAQVSQMSVGQFFGGLARAISGGGQGSDR